MDHNGTEKADAADAASAQVVKVVGAVEQANAEGHYEVKCVGPREEDRDRYVALRDELEAQKARSWLSKLLHKPLMKSVQREFDAIPLEGKWEDTICNLVVNVGKNLALDTILAGSAYTAACFVGLTQSSPTPASGDTMASHSGWVEAGATNAPTYTSPRKTPSWSAASGGSKATSSAMSFAMTGSGTVGGCFLVYGSGAVSTIDSTAGVLYSAGAFTGGNKTVSNGDTLNVTYTASL